MRLRLQRELSISQKGKVFKIIPLDIRLKADVFLFEILNTPLKPLAIKNNNTVQTYYDKYIKSANNSKAYKNHTRMSSLQKNSVQGT